MPVEPDHCVFSRWNRWPWRNERARNHHDRQAERVRRFDLGNGGIAARILGENSFDAMLPEQADIVLRREGASRLDHCDVRQAGRNRGPVDHADNISVLPRGSQLRKGKAADAAEDDARLWAERCDGGSNVRRLDPAISRLLLPSGPLDGEKRRAGHRGGLDRVAAHLASEGMRGVDQHIDAFHPQIAGKALRTAKTAASRWNWLSAGRGGPACERKDCFEAPVAGEESRKRARFRGAAQKEDAHGSRF